MASPIGTKNACGKLGEKLPPGVSRLPSPLGSGLPEVPRRVARVQERGALAPPQSPIADRISRPTPLWRILSATLVKAA